MKISINRNTVWCDILIQRLTQLGVQYACVSPGSRSTPLVLALSANPNIKIFPIVDERSSAFFAMGLAKQSDSPVVVITTSGTAVAELYPAIIESFYQRIPLIIITADRPPLLQNSGANQTINQTNIYANHIRHFIDAGLPQINNLNKAKLIAEDAVRHCSFINRGPVHINIPFEKPFEPSSYTDTIDINKLSKVFSDSRFEIIYKSGKRAENINRVKKFIEKTNKGIILVGYGKFNEVFLSELLKFSKKSGYPIYADGSTSLRYGTHSKKMIIENLSALLRSKKFRTFFTPELILQFGGAPTSNVMLDFFKESNAEKIIINEFGDRNDPSLSANKIITANPVEFLSELNEMEYISERDKKWSIDLLKLNSIASSIKSEFMSGAPLQFESKIVSEIVDALPPKCNLMISNSLPVRDFDSFSSTSSKKIKVFTNRGASGIDGINSTALGIAKGSKDPTFLVTGDLAFFHDMNGLHNAIKFDIPLNIILINNSGGGIFEALPIANFREHFEELFLTPLNIQFKLFIQAFGGSYFQISGWKELKSKLNSFRNNKSFSVFEIKTDARFSNLMRKKYWHSVEKQIDLFINENNC